MVPPSEHHLMGLSRGDQRPLTHPSLGPWLKARETRQLEEEDLNKFWKELFVALEKPVDQRDDLVNQVSRPPWNRGCPVTHPCPTGTSLSSKEQLREKFLLPKVVKPYPLLS